MNRATATQCEQELREVLPESWNVRADNTECRPGHPERFKVVAICAGMTIVADPDQRFHAYINTGPGLVERVSAHRWGVPTFENAREAFEAIRNKVVARYKAFSAMYYGLS